MTPAGQLTEILCHLNWGAIQTGLTCIFAAYCIFYFARWLIRQPFRQGIRVVIILASPALVRNLNNFIGYTSDFDHTYLGEMLNLITGWLPMIAFAYVASMCAMNKFTHARDKDGSKSND